MAASVLRPHDVPAVISHFGSSVDLLNAVHLAKHNRASVVALTRANVIPNVTTQKNGSTCTPMILRLLQLLVVAMLAIGRYCVWAKMSARRWSKSKTASGAKRLCCQAGMAIEFLLYSRTRITSTSWSSSSQSSSSACVIPPAVRPSAESMPASKRKTDSK